MADVEDVNFPWVIRLAREDAESLATLRLVPDIELAENGQEIWLRGPCGAASLDPKLSALPARGRYELLASDRLRRIDRRVPEARLADLRWQPLNEWLRVEPPSAALPAVEPPPIPLRLERSAEEREPGLLLTSLDAFNLFAARAARARLERLEFAADNRGRVLVRGEPLPPLPGCRFVLHGNVAVPAGFAWQPAVSAEVLVRRFGVTGDALVVWNEDGTITRLHGEQFVSATRSAVRMTARALR